MKHRSHFLFIISASLLALVSAPPGLTQQAPSGEAGTNTTSQGELNPYPAEVRQLILSNCVGDRGDQVQPFCNCLLEGIQRQYTFEEFMEVGAQIQQEGAPPDKFQQIVSSCESSS